MYDLAIIGGGPAGVSAGVYASRKRLKTVFITKDFLGQSSVSSGVENWIGTVKIRGEELSKNLENHLRAYASDIVDIKLGEICQSITKINGGFKISTPKSTYEARTVLITTGSVRRKLEVKGADIFDNKGLTYCATCDGPLFANQDVAVIGGGNAAFETAAQLLAYCRSVTLINRTENFRADEVTVANVKANPKMRIVTNAVTSEIVGDKFVSGLIYKDISSGKEEKLSVSGIFVEIGLIPNTYFVKELVQMDQWDHIVVDPRTQQSSVKGIWAAGDCTDGLYHQNNIASGDAIKALEDIYMFLTREKSQ
jgi:alkyl hydroperoxide reductase subunit F